MGLVDDAVSGNDNPPAWRKTPFYEREILAPDETPASGGRLLQKLGCVNMRWCFSLEPRYNVFGKSAWLQDFAFGSEEGYAAEFVSFVILSLERKREVAVALSRR